MKKKEKTPLAKNLVFYRNMLDLTQEKISKAVGVSRSAYAYYETDKQPKMSVLVKIAQVLNVTVNDLLRDESKSSDAVFKSPPFNYNTDNVPGLDFRNLKSNEKDIVINYRMLPAEAKKAVEEFIEAQLEKTEK